MARIRENSVPVGLARIITEVAQNEKLTVPEAVAEAVCRVRGHLDYENWIDGMVRHSVQEMIYDVRHRANMEAKYKDPSSHPTPKVRLGRSKEVAKVCVYYTLKFMGMMLGDMRRPDLIRAREAEKGFRDGHERNISMLDKLISQVTDENKTVRESVSVEEIEKMGKETYGDHEAA